MTKTDRLERARQNAAALLEELTQLRAEYDSLLEQTPALVGAREAAELMQIHRKEFSRRRRNGRIPPPIAELAAGPVWLRAQFTWPNTLEETA